MNLATWVAWAVRRVPRLSHSFQKRTIYARAEKLNVPIYMHPSLPHSAVIEAYYKDYLADFPMLPLPAW